MIMGFIAARMKMPPVVGYLLAGIIIGPATPGFVADIGLARQLAEIGVMLLMFGVGLHFSLGDLLAVRRVVVPGAVVQMCISAGLGIAVALFWGWTPGAAVVFGLTLSVASTVVVLRTLDAGRALQSINGRIAIGWLIVEDLVMVLVLVLLPPVGQALGGGQPAAGDSATSNSWGSGRLDSTSGARFSNVIRQPPLSTSPECARARWWRSPRPSGIPRVPWCMAARARALSVSARS